MTSPNLRPLGFGEILDGAFTLYRRNFLLFIGTSFLAMLGIVVAAVILGGTGAAMATVMPGPIAMLVMLLVLVAIAAVAMVLYGALTWQASQSYVGKKPSLGEGIEAGGRAAMTLVGAGLIVLLAFAAMMFVVILASVFLGAIVGALGIPALSVVVTLAASLGMLASIFFVAALFFGVVPAVVVEDKGPIEAVGRSVELARGALPRITGVMVVSLLITYLPFMAVIAFTGGFARAMNPQAAELAGNTGAVLMENLLTWLVCLLTTPFLLSVMVLLYYDRRVRMEALDVQMVTERLRLAGA